MNRIVRYLGVVLLVVTFGLAQSDSGSSSQALSVPYESLKWQPIVPEMGADSPLIAIVQVDPVSKATKLFIRTPKNMHVPMHWHSANETHTVIQGRADFAHGDKREHLGVGGFNYLPAKMQHEAWTSDNCVVFITVDSGWDVNWVGKPPNKTDAGQGLHK